MVGSKNIFLCKNLIQRTTASTSSYTKNYNSPISNEVPYLKLTQRHLIKMTPYNDGTQKVMRNFNETSIYFLNL